MDRTERCEMLARLADADLERLATLAIDAGRDRVTVTTGPTVGMVMARAVEGARGEVFNFGEVLVTECQVSVNGREGWSMLMGSRPAGALSAAALDAALAGAHPAAGRIDAELRGLAAAQDAATAARLAELSTTLVRFETQ